MATSMHPMRKIPRRPPSDDPDPRPTFRWQRSLTRYALWWAIAFMISFAAMICGGGVFLWAVYRESPSPGAISIGAVLFVFGFSAVVACLGVYVASSGYRGPRSGP
jgi:hypothetical protein